MKVVRFETDLIQVYNSKLGFVRTINVNDGQAFDSIDPEIIANVIQEGEQTPCPCKEV